MPSRYLSEEEKIKIVAIFLEKKVYRNTEMTPSYTLVVASYLIRSVYWKISILLWDIFDRAVLFGTLYTPFFQLDCFHSRQ